MNGAQRIAHIFIQEIPDDLAERTLYISIEHATALHRCLCGCGAEVVTPLAPTDWRLTFDGDTVSLSPSVGNWALSCRSHYWIERDQVFWARSFSDEQIRAIREHDGQLKSMYYSHEGDAVDGRRDPGELGDDAEGLWARVRRIFSRR